MITAKKVLNKILTEGLNIEEALQKLSFVDNVRVTHKSVVNDYGYGIDWYYTFPDGSVLKSRPNGMIDIGDTNVWREQLR